MAFSDALIRLFTIVATCSVNLPVTEGSSTHGPKHGCKAAKKPMQEDSVSLLQVLSSVKASSFQRSQKSGGEQNVNHDFSGERIRAKAPQTKKMQSAWSAASPSVGLEYEFTCIYVGVIQEGHTPENPKFGKGPDSYMFASQQYSTVNEKLPIWQATIDDLAREGANQWGLVELIGGPLQTDKEFNSFGKIMEVFFLALDGTFNSVEAQMWNIQNGHYKGQRQCVKVKHVASKMNELLAGSVSEVYGKWPNLVTDKHYVCKTDPVCRSNPQVNYGMILQNFIKGSCAYGQQDVLYTMQGSQAFSRCQENVQDWMQGEDAFKDAVQNDYTKSVICMMAVGVSIVSETKLNGQSLTINSVSPAAGGGSGGCSTIGYKNAYLTLPKLAWPDVIRADEKTAEAFLRWFNTNNAQAESKWSDAVGHLAEALNPRGAAKKKAGEGSGGVAPQIAKGTGKAPPLPANMAKKPAGKGIVPLAAAYMPRYKANWDAMLKGSIKPAAPCKARFKDESEEKLGPVDYDEEDPARVKLCLSLAPKPIGLGQISGLPAAVFENRKMPKSTEAWTTQFRLFDFQWTNREDQASCDNARSAGEKSSTLTCMHDQKEILKLLNFYENSKERIEYYKKLSLGTLCQ